MIEKKTVCSNVFVHKIRTPFETKVVVTQLLKLLNIFFIQSCSVVTCFSLIPLWVGGTVNTKRFVTGGVSFSSFFLLQNNEQQCKID